jgi:hypothetical protein
MITEIIGRIRQQQRRIVHDHPSLAPNVRGRLAMGLSIEEAGLLADVVEARRGALRVGRFALWNAGFGKVGITLVGDGEGGEFSEVDLAAVVEKFYGANF